MYGLSTQLEGALVYDFVSQSVVTRLYHFYLPFFFIPYAYEREELLVNMNSCKPGKKLVNETL